MRSRKLKFSGSSERANALSRRIFQISLEDRALSRSLSQTQSQPKETIFARVAGFSGGTGLIESGSSAGKSSTAFQLPSSCFL